MNKKTLWHILFWSTMLLYYISSAWPLEHDKIFLFERMFTKIIVQVVLSYCILYLFIPLLLNKKYRIPFVFSTLLSIYLAYVIYTGIRCYYLVPKYPEIFAVRPPLVFLDRITNGFAFLSNITGLIFPSIILLVFEYYQHEKEVLSLKEQKKNSELEALKNQLNPHFLFNTLNNLYALALKKSERTPEVIARLSDILDYILYRCKDKFVSIHNEVSLLENYIALERVRYGSRLDVDFSYEIKADVKIAPLLLLTFLENAFKHGVSQELNKASMQITLKANKQDINFKVVNTKPSFIGPKSKDNRTAIGLQNIKQQLEILYANNYNLVVHEEEQIFSAILNLISK